MRNELSKEVLKIRRYSSQEIPLLLEAARESTNETLNWMSWHHSDYAEKDSRSFVLSSDTAWHQKNGFDFAAGDVNDSSFLGGAELNQIGGTHKFADPGYWVRGSQNGRGIATAVAAFLAAKFGVAATCLHKKSFRLAFAVLLVCLNFLTNGAEAQSAAGKPTKDEKAVRASLDKLVAGFNDRDFEAVLSSFTEDAYILNPTRGVGDYKNLRESLAKAYAVPTKNPYTILVTVEEIQTSGNLAFVRLIWLRERKTDKAIISREKDLEIWRRQDDGKWKLARGYSYYFKEDYPLVSTAALAKSERAANKRNGKTTPPRQANDIEALKSALDKLVGSYNRRDLETAMSLYAPDSLLSHEGVADSNRDEARQSYARRFADWPPAPIKISYQLEELQTSGILAFARLVWLVERSSDKKILSRNNALEIWQRQKDGSWKLARGIGFYQKINEDATDD